MGSHHDHVAGISAGICWRASARAGGSGTAIVGSESTAGLSRGIGVHGIAEVRSYVADVMRYWLDHGATGWRRRRTPRVPPQRRHHPPRRLSTPHRTAPHPPLAYRRHTRRGTHSYLQQRVFKPRATVLGTPQHRMSAGDRQPIKGIHYDHSPFECRNLFGVKDLTCCVLSRFAPRTINHTSDSRP